MNRSRLRRAVSVAVTAALSSLAATLPLWAAPADAKLLAATDPFASAPAELRLELVFRAGARGAEVPLELWRKGDRLALVRFLAPKDLGKYVIRRDGAFWFLSPGAKQPVKLAPALAPAGGAALDDLLSVKPSRDYAIAAVDEVAGLVTFDLERKRSAGDVAGSNAIPRVRWVVDRAARVPVRAEFRDADNKVRRLIEFKRWKDPTKLVPAELIAKDVARGGLPLEVEFLAIEGREVPEALFDQTDGSARAALPLPIPGATASP